MNKKITMRSVITVLTLLSLLGCGEKKAPKEASANDTLVANHVRLTVQQQEHVGIEVGLPEFDTVSTILRLQGNIDVPPQSVVSLSFPLGGYLKSTGLLPGMHVRKGQVLAILEDMQFIQLQQDYLLAKERLILTESEYLRQRELNTSKASSDKVFEQARAEFASNKILVSALAQKLAVIGINPEGLKAETLSKEVRIHSPIDGYVSKVNVSIGKYTAPTDNLFELIDPRDIHLALTVFEGDLNKISVGQRVIAYSNDNPSKKYEARVIIGNKTLTNERLAEIHCHFEKYAPDLAPGMFMNGEVFVQSHDALTVPEEAVVRWENKYYVFIERGSREFDMVEVKAGVLDHGRQQIEAAGVTEQTRVVTKNAYALLMKMRNVDEEG
ncbi:MAG TPA: efflux RND transporter periplasmic adaptor subunit [Chryseolinea sp.]|nr:efflux RND transporter periplasmic adaptor subunit [Chryseolinea sp.]